MKILLFNDNPVVRKLVALSAQKTKDDLSVVWSVEEIEESEYDLLIIDDALYSEEVFEAIMNRVNVQSLLLMATRGKAIPAGFDNIINKPFLPTDLVDMLVQIEKKLSSSAEPSYQEPKQEPSAYAINLEENLPEPEGRTNELFDDNESEDELDLSDLEDMDENLLETAILDQEEVQEVQGLLDEAEEDDFSLEELSIPDSFEEKSDEEMSRPETSPFAEELEDEAFDFDSLIETGDLDSREPLGSKELLDENDFGEIDFSMPTEEEFESDEEGLTSDSDTTKEDDFGLDDLTVADEGALESLELDTDPLLGLEDDLSEDGSDDFDLESLMDDEALGDLESSIEEAVNDLDEDELSREVSSDDFGLDLDDLQIAEPTDELEMSMGELNENFDELDMLDERELKKAIGEEVEEEINCYETPNGSGLVCEALDEVMQEETFADEPQQTPNSSLETSHAEGVEALQALLKALANENVAKSLKGMNISININFGNDK